MIMKNNLAIFLHQQFAGVEIATENLETRPVLTITGDCSLSEVKHKVVSMAYLALRQGVDPQQVTKISISMARTIDDAMYYVTWLYLIAEQFPEAEVFVGCSGDKSNEWYINCKQDVLQHLHEHKPGVKVTWSEETTHNDFVKRVFAAEIEQYNAVRGSENQGQDLPEELGYNAKLVVSNQDYLYALAEGAVLGALSGLCASSLAVLVIYHCNVITVAALSVEETVLTAILSATVLSAIVGAGAAIAFNQIARA